MSWPSDHRIVLAYTLIVTVGLVALVYLQREQAGEITEVQRRVDRVEKVVEPTLANACMIFARIEREPKLCRPDEIPDPFIARVRGGDRPGPPPSGGGSPGGDQPPPDDSLLDPPSTGVEPVDEVVDQVCDLADEIADLC